MNHGKVNYRFALAYKPKIRRCDTLRHLEGLSP